MSFTERRAILLRVLEIDKKIRDIEHNPNYLSIKKSLRILEKPPGGPVVKIRSLNDPKETLELRKNGPELRLMIKKYREKMKVETEKIELLRLEKLELDRKRQSLLNSYQFQGN